MSDQAKTKEGRNALRKERQSMVSVVDRIAFDNQWVKSPTTGGNMPLGLVLMAFEEEDKT